MCMRAGDWLFGIGTSRWAPLTVVDPQCAVAHLPCPGDLDPLSLLHGLGAAQHRGAGTRVVPGAGRTADVSQQSYKHCRSHTV